MSQDQTISEEKQQHGESLLEENQIRYIEIFRRAMQIPYPSGPLAKEFRVSRARINQILSEMGFSGKARIRHRDDLLIGDYDDGLSISALSEKYDLSEGSVQRIINKHGRSRLPTKRESVLREIERLETAGLSSHQIANRVGLSQGAVNKIMSWTKGSILRCEGCGIEFEQKYKQQRYHSKKCLLSNVPQEAQKVDAVCIECGRHFRAWRSTKGKYCSNFCQQVWLRRPHQHMNAQMKALHQKGKSYADIARLLGLDRSAVRKRILRLRPLPPVGWGDEAKVERHLRSLTAQGRIVVRRIISDTNREYQRLVSAKQEMKHE